MRGKRGQLDLSFGMIFSIILIIAIIAVSFYVIQYFTELSTCTATGLFYNALQKEIDTAWQSSSSKQLFYADVPNSVDYICVGNMSSTAQTKDKVIFDELYKIYRLSDANIFVYPQNEGCQGLGGRNINHLFSKEFFCVKNDDGQIKILIEKNSFDTAVSVKQT